MPDFDLTLTARRQFDDWTPLLDLYRSAPPNITVVEANAMREKALEITWCAAYLPHGTLRAPYCTCLERQSSDYIDSVSRGSAVIDVVIKGFVSCLSTRPVWRVRPVWGVQFGTPAVYVHFISSCFLWVAAGFSRKLTSIPVWAFSITVSVVLLAEAPVATCLWVFTVMLMALLIEWVFLPGMKPHPAGAGYVSMVPNAAVERLPSSFWWCEYLCAPVFAFYIPLMHCGRDIFFVSIMAMLGAAVGGLGLRSYWCSQALSEEPRNQFRVVIQCITWLGILAASVSIITMAAIYYNEAPKFVMGAGSIVLACFTIAIGLMQWPHVQGESWVLVAQAAVALVRNVILFALVAIDMRQSIII